MAPNPSAGYEPWNGAICPPARGSKALPVTGGETAHHVKRLAQESELFLSFSKESISTRKLPPWRLPPQLFTLFSISGHFRGSYLCFLSFSCLQLWSQQIIWSCVIRQTKILQSWHPMAVLHLCNFDGGLQSLPRFGWSGPKMFWYVEGCPHSPNDWINPTKKCLDELRVDAHTKEFPVLLRFILIIGILLVVFNAPQMDLFDSTLVAIFWLRRISHVDQKRVLPFFCI